MSGRSGDKKYDLAVIGGGPAGMMAAGRAAEVGVRVILLEKNDRLGAKLRITGKGRCNITYAEDSLNVVIKAYGSRGKFLYSAFNKFSNVDIISFFESRGLITKIERGGRVFPVSDSALDVLGCLESYLSENGVDVRLCSPVKNVISDNATGKSSINKIILRSGEEIYADAYLITTGGKSYPGTGSSGDGYAWLKRLGHTIIRPRPSLTPILIKEKWLRELEGLSLKNVAISLWGKRKLDSRFGEAVFMNNGLSGPVILDLSRVIIAAEEKDLSLKIDFKPALDYPTLDKRLLRDFAEQNNKQFKNSLSLLLPSKLIPVFVRLSGISPSKKVNEITKSERKKLIKLFKEFTLTVSGLVSFEKAIITSGGVCLKEIDPKTMRSKIIDNLYCAGEVLDIDGPTGGYNLQVAWSTGYAVGEAMILKNFSNVPGN